MNITKEYIDDFFIENTISNEYLEESLTSAYNKLINYFEKPNNIKKTTKQYSKKLKNIERELKKEVGSGVVRTVKKNATRSAKKAQKIISRTTKPTRNLIEIAAESFKNGFKNIFTDFSLRGLGNKTLSVTLMIIVIFINTLAMSFLVSSSHITPILAFMICAVFVGPITEETSKAFSIHFGFGDEYIAILNIGEFFLYMYSFYSKGFNLALGFLIRLIGVVKQYMLYAIHKKHIEEDDSIVGLPIAILLHSLYNATLGMVFFVPELLLYPDDTEQEMENPSEAIAKA